MIDIATALTTYQGDKEESFLVYFSWCLFKTSFLHETKWNKEESIMEKKWQSLNNFKIEKVFKNISGFGQAVSA